MTRRRPLASLADRLWKAPFVLASVIMLAAGIAQSLGRTEMPRLASLAALAVVAVGTPLGLLALRAHPGSQIDPPQLVMTSSPSSPPPESRPQP